MQWNLSASYLGLPDPFYSVQAPSPVVSPRVAVFNHALARNLGLGSWNDSDLAVLAGNQAPGGATTFAQAYAGHQYAHFTMLGDGRALVLGEHRTPDGRLVDLQLKGSGPTPYSRSGDGRAALGPMLREYLISEAMAGLGIPTSRSLAVVHSGETVWREGPQPGAILTRVAASHLRVGTVEYASATGDLDALQALVRYALNRHFPDARPEPSPADALLRSVIAVQARLVARWMAVGFVHGVLNTDNVALSGESLDFGPCAFLDAYHPTQVYSSIDRRGRYAYGNQPGITQWNLTRLAEALLPAMDEDESQALARAQALIDGMVGLYQVHYEGLMAAKLGLAEAREDDKALVDDLLAWMDETGADYTLTFRRLADTGTGAGPAGWVDRWRQRRSHEDPAESQRLMERSNPVYLARNHQVERALQAAEGGDFEPFHTLVDVLRAPFDRRPGREDYESPPPADLAAVPYVTYCGT